MKRTLTELEKKRLENYLNERYENIKSFNRHDDIVYYDGILKSLEILGIFYIRFQDGHHEITL